MSEHNRVADLAAALRDDDRLGGTLHRVTDLAVSSLPGCDAAVVWLSADLGPLSPTASSGGPAVEEAFAREAVRAGAPQASPLSYAVPLFLQGSAVGAFSVSGASPGAFGPLEWALVEVFAEHAAVVLANARLVAAWGRLSSALYDGLAGSDDVVDQARGVLMEQRRCGAAEAADALEDEARRSGRTLDQVAASLVATASAG